MTYLRWYHRLATTTATFFLHELRGPFKNESIAQANALTCSMQCASWCHIMHEQSSHLPLIAFQFHRCMMWYHEAHCIEQVRALACAIEMLRTAKSVRWCKCHRCRPLDTQNKKTNATHRRLNCIPIDKQRFCVKDGFRMTRYSIVDERTYAGDIFHIDIMPGHVSGTIT